MICGEENIQQNENIINCIDFNLKNIQTRMSSLEINFDSKQPSNDSPDQAHSSPRTPDRAGRSTRYRQLQHQRKDPNPKLHRTVNRVISKLSTSNKSNAKAVESFYLKTKMTKLKPTCLETIFEQEEQRHNSEEEGIQNGPLSDVQMQFFGSRKLKRSLSFSECSKAPKNVLQRRKKRIKTCLGKPKKMNKMSMDEFLQKLQNSWNDTETVNSVQNNESVVLMSNDKSFPVNAEAMFSND